MNDINWKSVNTPPENFTEVLVSYKNDLNIIETELCIYVNGKYLCYSKDINMSKKVIYWAYKPKSYKF